MAESATEDQKAVATVRKGNGAQENLEGPGARSGRN